MLAITIRLQLVHVASCSAQTILLQTGYHLQIALQSTGPTSFTTRFSVAHKHLLIDVF